MGRIEERENGHKEIEKLKEGEGKREERTAKE